MKSGISQTDFHRILSKKFDENPSSWSRDDMCGQMGRRKDRHDKANRRFSRETRKRLKKETGHGPTRTNKILKYWGKYSKTEWGRSKLPALAFILKKFVMKADIKRKLL